MFCGSIESSIVQESLKSSFTFEKNLRSFVTLFARYNFVYYLQIEYIFFRR